MTLKKFPFPYSGGLAGGKNNQAAVSAICHLIDVVPTNRAVRAFWLEHVYLLKNHDLIQ